MKDKEKQSLIDKWVNLLIDTDFYSEKMQSEGGNIVTPNNMRTMAKSFWGELIEESVVASSIATIALGSKMQNISSSSYSIKQVRKNIHWLEETDYDFAEAYKKMHSEQQLSDFYVQMVLLFPSQWLEGVEVPDSAVNVAVRTDIDKSAYRQNFHIPYEEQIFYVRDTSRWSTDNQGLVITDTSFYCIPDNKKPDEMITFAWTAIERVTYMEEILFFWDSSMKNIDDACPIPISYFAKGVYDSQKIGTALADYFTHLASLAVVDEKPDQMDEEIEQIISLKEQKDFDAAMALVEQRLGEGGDDGYYRYLAANVLSAKADEEANENDRLSIRTEAISHITKGLPLSTEGSWGWTCLKSLYAKQKFCLGDYQEARKAALAAVLHGDKEDTDTEREQFSTYDETFAKEQFPTLDYVHRKALMVVDEYTELEQKQVQVLSKEVAAKYLKFPMGHPHSNQLYIAHPLINNYYVPFEDYQFVFIEDQVREYCELAQALGATEITIECLNEKQDDSQDTGNKHINANAGRKGGGINVDYQGNSSHHLIDSIRHSLEMHQTYQPVEAPYVPENLVWYPQMPSWRHLATQRLNGRLNSHEEKMQTQKSQVVDGNELKQIKGEVHTLLTSAGIDSSKELSSKYQLQENAVLCIKITFAPIDQLQSTVLPNVQSAPALSANEQKFMDEVKFCLEEDNNLSDSDKKYLERKQAKLGISAERAAEIIQMCMPSLSAEEQEYIDTFHELVESSEEISPKIRRILDREAESLGISETRKTELEKM